MGSRSVLQVLPYMPAWFSCSRWSRGVMQGIREMGGHTKTASLLGMDTSRRPRRHWWDLGQVVTELRAYLQGRPDIREQRRLPTHRSACLHGSWSAEYALLYHACSAACY